MVYHRADDIIDTALKAMTKAAKEYSSEWSYGWFAPWQAPEYVYTTAIARALNKKSDELGHVYCEQNMREIIRWSKKKGKKSGRLPKTASKGARVDIAVVDAKDIDYRFCLEVKRGALSLSNIGEDMIRCSDIIEKSSRRQTVDDAAVIFMTCRNRSEKDGDGAISEAGRQCLENRLHNTFVGLGGPSKYTKKIKKLKDQGFSIEPHYHKGKFQVCEIYNDDGEVSHYADWVAAAIKISLPKQRQK